MRDPAYRPQLDGLRALAVAAVAWSHWMPGAQFGVPFGAGVHLFFVLSGFLITGLLRDLAESGDRRRGLVRFYLRRVLRLTPAFWLTLALAWWADVPGLRQSVGWHLAYLSNIWIVRDASWHGVLSHFWSLAVEEQFYLIWPWVILWTPRHRRVTVTLVAVVLGPLARLAASSTGLAEPFHALVPGGSADSLAIGAWLALSQPQAAGRQREVQETRLSTRVGWLAVAGAAGWTMLRLVEVAGPLPVLLVVWRQVLQGLVFVWIVWRAAHGVQGWLGAVLAHPVLRYLGRISYGLYLVHNFAPDLARALVGMIGLDADIARHGVTRLLLLSAVTLACAAASWHLVEAPVNRLKARLR